MRLSFCELLSSHEVLKRFVISVDLELGVGSFEFWPPLFQGTDDHKHFLIVDLVVALREGHSLQEVGYWVSFCVRVLLREDFCDNLIGGVSLHHRREVHIIMSEEGGRSELVLEFLKGFCTDLIEGEGNVCLNEVD